ncbi:MAG: bifunctional riboflavin kinase/FAD synthetase [Chitinophagaceae bacterium]|nr:bifunctional riboflavin kinase/FAD synthetase [Chitinophagaceae bacterium]
MQIHPDISVLPFFRNAVVTIGTFDGVHTGHKQIIKQLKEEAKRINGETVIVTFFPHPRKVINPDASIELLNTPEEKATLLAAEGIDHLVIVPFTKAFAEQPASEYITVFLQGRLHPHTVIIGYDHRFGKNREGNYLMLEAFSKQCNFEVKEIPEKVLLETAVSSTRIRKAIVEGDIATANALLGYDYFFGGTVVDGNKLGRTLGYPTANIQPDNPEKLIPGFGIYTVEVEIKGRKYGGMMSIGTRPTIDDGNTSVIEVNIFDFNDNIYGESIKVYMKAYLRPELKFNSLDALRDQLALDKEDSLRILTR